MITKTITLFFSIIVFQTAAAQDSDLKKDIDDVFLKKLLIEKDTARIAKFQNYAISLFINGVSINDSIFGKAEKKFIGVCIMNERDSLSERKLDFNLYTLCYKNNRETDFHKRIYYPGSEKIANFHVICHTESGRKKLASAIKVYLDENLIPKSNDTYTFSRNHTPDETKFEKLFKSDKISTIAIGHSYSYLRMNGNYIIQIQGFPDRSLDEDSENLYVTEKFLEDWHSITVYIINEDLQGSYLKKF